MSGLHPEFDDALLERDAMAFFSLDAGWEPAALKRAYSAQIRRWKPERFPEEFKRVRAAYERLIALGGGGAAGSLEAPTVTPPASPAASPAPSPAPETAPVASVRERLEAGEPEAVLAALEAMPRRSLHEDLALAYLRAPRAGVWPPVCLDTLAAAWIAHGDESDLGCIVAAVERSLASVPPGGWRDALERFASFAPTPVYWDITGDLWIAFSKSEPDACLMRVDRMIHFGEPGRGPRHGYWLLRFCVAGAMRLPVAWIREQLRHLRSLPGFVESDMPAAGRLAAHRVLRHGVVSVVSELAFLEALLALRGRLESAPRGARAPALLRYMLRAYCDGDADALYAAWRRYARLAFDDYAPFSSDAAPMVLVAERLRFELDAAVAVRVRRPARILTALARTAVVSTWIVTAGVAWIAGLVAIVLLIASSAALTNVDATGLSVACALVVPPVAALGVFAWRRRRDPKSGPAWVSRVLWVARAVRRRYRMLPFDLLLLFSRWRWLSVSAWTGGFFRGCTGEHLFRRLRSCDSYRLRLSLFH